MLRDKRVWLGVATVVVLIMAWRVLMPDTTTAATAPAAASPRSAARTPAAADALELRPVRLDALTASREEPNQAKRNPFRFYQPPPPPPPPKPVFIPPPPEVTGPIVPREPAGPAPPLPIPLKLLGIVERANGVKWAVLSDGKSAPQHGKEGDVIDGRYRIVKIGTESIELTYVDGRGRQTVRLTGQ